MYELVQKKCMPCVVGAKCLQGEELKSYMKLVNGDWILDKEHHIEKQYAFRNFRQALAFVNAIGRIAEEEGHHPDLHLSWGQVKVFLWTHKIGGLCENDFIMAAKIDAIYVSLGQSR